MSYPIIYRDEEKIVLRTSPGSEIHEIIHHARNLCNTEHVEYVEFTFNRATLRVYAEKEEESSMDIKSMLRNAPPFYPFDNYRWCGARREFSGPLINFVETWGMLMQLWITGKGELTSEVVQKTCMKANTQYRLPESSLTKAWELLELHWGYGHYLSKIRHNQIFQRWGLS